MVVGVHIDFVLNKKEQRTLGHGGFIIRIKKANLLVYGLVTGSNFTHPDIDIVFLFAEFTHPRKWILDQTPIGNIRDYNA